MHFCSVSVWVTSWLVADIVSWTVNVYLNAGICNAMGPGLYCPQTLKKNRQTEGAVTHPRATVLSLPARGVRRQNYPWASSTAAVRTCNSGDPMLRIDTCNGHTLWRGNSPSNHTLYGSCGK
jgi:hypothetical protein